MQIQYLLLYTYSVLKKLDITCTCIPNVQKSKIRWPFQPDLQTLFLLFYCLPVLHLPSRLWFLWVAMEILDQLDLPGAYYRHPLLLLFHLCHLKGSVLEFLKPCISLKVCSREIVNQKIALKNIAVLNVHVHIFMRRRLPPKLSLKFYYAVCQCGF